MADAGTKSDDVPIGGDGDIFADERQRELKKSIFDSTKCLWTFFKEHVLKDQDFAPFMKVQETTSGREPRWFCITDRRSFLALFSKKVGVYGSKNPNQSFHTMKNRLCLSGLLYDKEGDLFTLLSVARVVCFICCIVGKFSL